MLRFNYQFITLGAAHYGKWEGVGVGGKSWREERLFVIKLTYNLSINIKLIKF